MNSKFSKRFKWFWYRFTIEWTDFTKLNLMKIHFIQRIALASSCRFKSANSIFRCLFCMSWSIPQKRSPSARKSRFASWSIINNWMNFSITSDSNLKIYRTHWLSSIDLTNDGFIKWNFQFYFILFEERQLTLSWMLYQ